MNPVQSKGPMRILKSCFIKLNNFCKGMLTLCLASPEQMELSVDAYMDSRWHTPYRMEEVP